MGHQRPKNNAAEEEKEKGLDWSPWLPCRPGRPSQPPPFYPLQRAFTATLGAVWLVLGGTLAPIWTLHPINPKPKTGSMTRLRYRSCVVAQCSDLGGVGIFHLLLADEP